MEVDLHLRSRCAAKFRDLAAYVRVPLLDGVKEGVPRRDPVVVVKLARQLAKLSLPQPGAVERHRLAAGMERLEVIANCNEHVPFRRERAAPAEDPRVQPSIEVLAH